MAKMKIRFCWHNWKWEAPNSLRGLHPKHLTLYARHKCTKCNNVKYTLYNGPPPGNFLGLDLDSRRNLQGDKNDFYHYKIK